MDDILAGLRLNEEQQRAAYQEGCDVAVLAGAGCGKTTTLVAHYLYLLSCGLAPDGIVAITFTDRAGQEMRARIRRVLRAYLDKNPADQGVWLERYIALDGAPIGTIHRFCARLLRAHPAEAGLDPSFVVLEENRAAALAAEAVERALTWATQEEEIAPCFELFGRADGLRALLALLLKHRLDVEPALRDEPDLRQRWEEARRRWLADTLHQPAWEQNLEVLRRCEPLDAADPLNSYRLEALEAVEGARRLAMAGDWDGALASLEGRLKKPGQAGNKKCWGEAVTQVRDALRKLADLYGKQIASVTDKGDPELDEALATAWPALVRLFSQAVRDYEALKAREQAVDFDDLEAGALRLLQGCPEVAGYYHGQIKAVLVDEFQDTNERQRRLIEALVGAPAGQSGRLFVVGDAKQSIYRFRGADVTVFRHVERQISQQGGQLVSINQSYRAHGGLTEILNRLLAEVLGAAEDDPGRPYWVPFAALHPVRAEPRPGISRPYLELHLGVGKTAEEGRRAAARGLAGRLAELHRREQVSWGEMACLFRATTHFDLYEEAFEQADIPYVTVAGKGFYDRPEVRDLLNALRALAYPNDDLALAGLLRSPAIGLTDVSLYLLRWGADHRPHSLWLALQSDLEQLGPAQAARARWAAQLLAELAPLVGREPVATILKRFLDWTGYLAILRLCPGSERAARNVDKLLADAHRSAAVGLGDFLEYIQTLSDTAAREGEAPPEAGEAVQLMSVHKAKGLEFDLVVIADAGHSDAAHIPDLLLHPEWGLLLRVRRSDGEQAREGLMHSLARPREGEMQDAEERRLLYVAATRAREKLLISSHVEQGKGGIRYSGWLKRLARALGEEEMPASAPPPGEQTATSLWGGEVACTIYTLPAATTEAPEPLATEATPLAVPVGPLPTTLARPYIAEAAPAGARAGLEPTTPDRVWRVVPRHRGQEPPAWVVGQLVHLGLRMWRFPPDPLLPEFLRAEARSAGLTDEDRIRTSVRKASELLARLHGSDLFPKLDRAAERYHEVPYAHSADPKLGGRIDLLCREPGGRWWIIDFKTDRLATEDQLSQKEAEYALQLRRYRQAVADLLGQDPRLSLCFLDYANTVQLREVAP